MFKCASLQWSSLTKERFNPLLSGRLRFLLSKEAKCRRQGNFKLLKVLPWQSQKALGWEGFFRISPSLGWGTFSLLASALTWICLGNERNSLLHPCFPTSNMFMFKGFSLVESKLEVNGIKRKSKGSQGSFVQEHLGKELKRQMGNATDLRDSELELVLSWIHPELCVPLGWIFRALPHPAWLADQRNYPFSFVPGTFIMWNYFVTVKRSTTVISPIWNFNIQYNSINPKFQTHFDWIKKNQRSYNESFM